MLRKIIKGTTPKRKGILVTPTALGTVSTNEEPKQKKKKKTEVNDWNLQAVGKLGRGQEIYEPTMIRTRASKTRTRKRRRRGFVIQKLLGKKGIEFYWPGY